MFSSFIHIFMHCFITPLSMCSSLFCAIMMRLSKEEGVVNFFYLSLCLSFLLHKALYVLFPQTLFYQASSVFSLCTFNLYLSFVLHPLAFKLENFPSRNVSLLWSSGYSTKSHYPSDMSSYSVISVSTVTSHSSSHCTWTPLKLP